LLERLDQTVEQNPIKATISKSNVIVVMLVESVHGKLPCGPISREIEERSGREVALGSVYATLERLEEKGFATSRFGDSTPERGGRAKRYFHITEKGLREVGEAQRTLRKLWQGLPQLEGRTA
jgi:PadR family transcriptional regulator, regulatory protein PadR